MPNISITVKGLKGLSQATNEFARAIQGPLFERSLSSISQETHDRLESDTPVITGRLLRSTVLRKDSTTKWTLGHFAPYANVVNNRRGYWQGAIQVAQKWPLWYGKTVQNEWGIMARRYANT